MPRALVRSVPDSFAEAIVSGPRPTFDIQLARAQHEAYVGMLEAAGYEVTTVAADEEAPDCPFVEDTAVMLREVAIMTRPGAPSRRREVGPVGDALDAAGIDLVWMGGQATVDGGDVLRLGDYLYVGLSTRTNAAGAAFLGAAAAEQGLWAIEVDVGRGLHLKSAVNALDDKTVLMAPQLAAEADFVGVDIVPTGEGESWAANALALADGTVLVPAGAERTRAIIESAGFVTRTIDISEFTKADGGLTCLSIRY